MDQEPSPRNNHLCLSFGFWSFLWGGGPKDHASEQAMAGLSSKVYIFDHFNNSWRQEVTTGDHPPGIRYGGCVAVLDNLYTFGGRDSCGKRFNTLHQLNTVKLEWKRMPCREPPKDAPTCKSGCGMVAFDNTLGLIGGYGIPVSKQLESQFVEDTSERDGRGWTNEFHLYDLKKGFPTGMWNSPKITGDRPPPCSYFTFTSVDSRRAVFFGGSSQMGRLNDVYIATLQEEHVVHFKRLEQSRPWPEKRSSHAACVLNYGKEDPQLLVIGGLSEEHKTLGDIWLLSVDNEKWRRVECSHPMLSRWRHSLSSVCLSKERCSVLLFGGEDNTATKLAQTTVLEFVMVEHSKQWNLKSITTFGVSAEVNHPIQEVGNGTVSDLVLTV